MALEYFMSYEWSLVFLFPTPDEKGFVFIFLPE